MAGFIMKQMVGNKLTEVTGGLKMDGDGEGNKAEEDPEVVAARKEQEEKRKEKHRRMEVEREKMRDGIRNKYSLHKKDDMVPGMPVGMGMDPRVGSARKKTPEELAQEMQAGEDDSIIGQLGLTEQVEKAKTQFNSAFESVKGFLPFGK